MSNEQLKDALNKAVTADQNPGKDVELTDADLEDVAGGCGAMCGTFHILEE